MATPTRTRQLLAQLLAVNPICIGNVFFVGSTITGAANSAGRGLQVDEVFSTINYAISACSANNGDVVCVAQNHVETVTAAAGVAASKAGVTVVGLGRGRARPKINYTTAVGASVDVTAANVTFQNLVFTPIGFDAVTAAINVSAADFAMIGCEMEFADATNQATLGILTASGADRMLIQDCWFHGSANAGTAACIRIAAGNDIRILGTTITGNFTTTLGAIDNSAAVTNLQVKNCVLANNTASSTKAIVCHASTTADLSDNIYRILSGTAPVTCAAGYGAGRSYYTAAVGVSAGTLI